MRWTMRPSAWETVRLPRAGICVDDDRRGVRSKQKISLERDTGSHHNVYVRTVSHHQLVDVVDIMRIYLQ